MLVTNKSLEYLGLAKNNISNLDPIFEKLTKRVLDEAEVANLKNRQAEKDVIIAKNAKQKLEKNREPVPFVEPLYQEDAGKILKIFINFQ